MARATEPKRAWTPDKAELTTENMLCFDCGGRYRLTVVRTDDGPVVLCASCRDA